MQAGLVFAADELELFASASASFSRSDTLNGIIYIAGSTSYYCPDPLHQTPSIDFSIIGHVAPVPGPATNTVSLTVAGLGTWSIGLGTTFPASASYSVLFTGLRLYQSGGGWLMKWATATVTLNGTVEYSGGAASTGSGNLTPAGIPFIGVPPTIGTRIVAATELSLGPLVGAGTTPFVHEYSGGSSITGGYRWKEAGVGTWSAAPIDLNVLIGAGTGCDCDPSTISTPSGADTASASIDAGFSQINNCIDEGTFPIVTGGLVAGQQEIYVSTQKEEIWSGQLTVVPNLPRTLRRFGPDYAALIYRGGLPRCQANYNDTCTDYLTGSPIITGFVNITNDILPRESQFLSTVTATPNIIEAPLNLQTPAPYVVGGTKLFNQAFAVVIISPASGGTAIDYTQMWPNEGCFGVKGSSFPSSVDDSSGNPQMTPGLYNLNPLPRYVNYWSSGLWNYAYWFPPDTPFNSNSWPVDGADAPASQYWLPSRQQWVHNHALPVTSETKKRADLISAPLQTGGLQSFWPGFFGGQNLVSPWGISRFIAQQVTLPSSVTLTQAQTAIWSFTHATAVFGVSDITLTPTSSPATVVATLALGSFANSPYQILQLIKTIALSFAGAGVSGTVIQLKGVDGATLNLGTVPGVYAWPLKASDTKYAGSWGQDFGVAFLATDIGTDTMANGISASENGSAENAFAYQLLLGFTAKQLTFTFTISDPTKTISIDYPVFNLPADIPVLVQESGFCSIILFGNCGGIRFGPWDWWNYLFATYQDPPTVYPYGQPSSVLDWLAGRRVMFDQQASTSGLDAEWATLYDSTEAGARSDIANSTLSFMLVRNKKLTGILVNSMAEVPPIAQLPRRARDVDLQPTGAWACESWSHAKGPRDVVSAQVEADLFDSSGVQRSTALSGMPSGWTCSRFDRAVTNLEDATWTMRAGGATYADVSPWHGYSMVLQPGGCVSPRLYESETGQLYVACLQGGDIYFQWSQFTTGPFAFKSRVTNDGGWSGQRFCIDDRGRVELRAVQGAHAYRMWSDDDGLTWGPLIAGAFTPELVI